MSGLASRLLMMAALLSFAATGSALATDPSALPPALGPTEPRVAPIKGEDGLFLQSWFVTSFLDLKDDHAEAKSKGRRFAVIFEQRGCVYCTKMHTDVLSQRYINDYVRDNFSIVQLDLWGSREVTDFDGTKLPEKKLAERWGVLFTPTIVFLKEDLTPYAGKWGPPLEVARLPLGFGPATFYDLFVWVKAKVYETDASFQRFHITRMAERDAARAGDGKGKVN
ncbi:MAG: thioredoxin family protein [Hyphomicrobiaceae bacterium]|nr:thioredoxin family protein [Hyphomicrobiaceae bacterium]